MVALLVTPLFFRPTVTDTEANISQPAALPQPPMPEIRKEFIETGKIQYVVRDFPLSFHPNAVAFSKAMRAAGTGAAAPGTTQALELYCVLRQEAVVPVSSRSV